MEPAGFVSLEGCVRVTHERERVTRIVSPVAGARTDTGALARLHSIHGWFRLIHLGCDPWAERDARALQDPLSITSS